MIHKDSLKLSGKKPVEGTDYIETSDTFTILNVPILAEMVQFYPGEGNALKAKDEIVKVIVNNVPLTIVDNAPTHPDHLAGLNTLEKADVVVGFMSEPSKPKNNMSSNKRYADFVLFNTPKIDALKSLYLSGSYIDTSIGFNFKKDATPGKWLDVVEYDFVQRDIILDHNAILIDRVGNLGVGRMPSPIGGIGADSKENNIGGIKMSDELKIQNDALKLEIDTLTKELEKFKTSDADAKIKALETSIQDANTAKDKLSVELKDVKDELDKVKADLKVYTDKEAVELNQRKDTLKKHYADFAELFDKADAEYINKKFDEMNNKSQKKDIGTDMFGVKAKEESKAEQERFNKMYGKK